MNPVDFPQSNVTFAKDQPEYRPLPAHRTDAGIVTSCWELSDEELAEITKTKRIWFSVYTFNQPLQPQLPMAHDPFK